MTVNLGFPIVSNLVSSVFKMDSSLLLRFTLHPFFLVGAFCDIVTLSFFGPFLILGKPMTCIQLN